MNAPRGMISKDQFLKPHIILWRSQGQVFHCSMHPLFNFATAKQPQIPSAESTFLHRVLKLITSCHLSRRPILQYPVLSVVHTIFIYQCLGDGTIQMLACCRKNHHFVCHISIFFHNFLLLAPTIFFLRDAVLEVLETKAPCQLSLGPNIGDFSSVRLLGLIIKTTQLS
jgi:hypothetical protein